MEFSAVYNFKRPIHHLIFSGSFFVGVDNETGFVFYDRQLDKLTNVQKFASPIPHPHHRATGSSINGKLALIYLYSKKMAYLLLYSEEKKRYVMARELGWSKHELECSAFDYQNHLFATGDNEGKVQVYSCKNGKLYLSLPKRSDYIATMAFNRDGNLLGYSAYDKSVTVYDLHRNKVLYAGTGQSDSVVMALCFLYHSNTMILAGRDGRVLLYDFFKKKVVRTLLMCPAWPMSIYVDENDRYVIVADKGGTVHLADLMDETIPPAILHKAPGAVLDIRHFGHSLYFIFETGVMQSIDLNLTQKELNEAFDAGDYTRCYQLIEANRLFYHTSIKEKLDTVFSELVKEAITLIANGKLNEAQQLLRPFEFDEKHAKKINQTVRAAKKIYDFSQLIKNREFDKAYKMAETEPFYKELPLYEKMEKDFMTCFDKASYLLTQKAPDIPAARELVKPYTVVAAKAQIVKNLFSNPILHNKAKLLFIQKEYAILQKLFEKYPVLKDAPVYGEFKDFVANLEFFFELNMEMQEYKEALESTVVIEKHFPRLAVKLKEGIARLKVIVAFINALQEDAYLVALGLASRNEYLIELSEYRKLDRFLNKKFDMAISLARRGDYGMLVRALTPFVKNKNLQARAISIYRLYYIEQIMGKKAALKQEEWETTFRNYCRWFGADDEIREIAASVELKDILKQYEDQTFDAFDPKVLCEFIYKTEE